MAPLISYLFLSRNLGYVTKTVLRGCIPPPFHASNSRQRRVITFNPLRPSTIMNRNAMGVEKMSVHWQLQTTITNNRNHRVFLYSLLTLGGPILPILSFQVSSSSPSMRSLTLGGGTAMQGKEKSMTSPASTLISLGILSVSMRGAFSPERNHQRQRRPKDRA